MSTRVSRAVDRALDERHREATGEVERILAAAVQVMQSMAPEAPRVSDIVTAAGSSKKAFYRYFSGKDELLLAVMERGIDIVVSYLRHQMSKATRPVDKVTRWIEGTLAQVADPHLNSMSRAVVEQMTASPQSGGVSDIMGPMRTLLIEPITDLGSDDVARDVDAVFQLTVATMSRYIGSGSQPEAEDIAHLVRFCLRGLDAPVMEGQSR